MIGDLFGVLIIALIIYFIIHLYLKNKREGKDDYTNFNDGSGNIMYWFLHYQPPSITYLRAI